MNRKISVILPTYNESGNIGQLVDEISNHLRDKDFEILVVDDNSPDGTSQIVEGMKKDNQNLKLLCRKNERGLTSALNDGIALADGHIVVWMDCDFQMPPSVVPELVKEVENGYDAAIGSRYAEGGKDLRYQYNLNSKYLTVLQTYLSIAICRFTSFLFASNHKDWTSGFIAIKKKLFDRMDLFGEYGEYFMYLIHNLENSGYKITEIPYTLAPRKIGESKTAVGFLGMVFKGIKYIRAVIRLKLLDYLYYSIYKKTPKYYDRSDFDDK